ncbi:Cytochrome P450 - like 10 [Theobroma cacao]|nr:Cytochrome P450 - like 10 [Theobroma cacao]
MKATESSKNEDDFNFLKCYLTEHEVTGPTPNSNLIRNNIIFFLLTADDTTSATLSWFFYLISKNSIRRAGKKLVSRTSTRTAITVALEQVEQVGVSPCGFIYETLRLYPPAPFEIRKPTQPDTLPSGHHVDQNTRILICTYAMGRTTWLWGEDYLEVKPERWITKEGKLRREPPSKFFSFNAGPRNCPGKNLALIMMKATIATIFHYYNVQVIDQGQNVTLKHGVILHMKHGLRARIKNRWS